MDVLSAVFISLGVACEAIRITLVALLEHAAWVSSIFRTILVILFNCSSSLSLSMQIVLSELFICALEVCGNKVCKISRKKIGNRIGISQSKIYTKREQ